MDNVVAFPKTQRIEQVEELTINIQRNELYLQGLIYEGADPDWIEKVSSLVKNQKELLPYVKSGEISRIVYVRLQRRNVSV